MSFQTKNYRINLPVCLQRGDQTFLVSSREKVFQSSSADTSFFSPDEDEDDDGLGIWTHVRLSVFLCVSKGDLVKHWQLVPGSPPRSTVPLRSQRGTAGRSFVLSQQKTTRHPAGCGLNPLKAHSERGYRWSCTKEKQIMRRQEVLQPPSGLSADQSAVGGKGGRGGRISGWMYVSRPDVVSHFGKFLKALVLN